MDSMVSQNLTENAIEVKNALHRFTIAINDRLRVNKYFPRPWLLCKQYKVVIEVVVGGTGTSMEYNVDNGHVIKNSPLRQVLFIKCLGSKGTF